MARPPRRVGSLRRSRHRSRHRRSRQAHQGPESQHAPKLGMMRLWDGSVVHWRSRSVTTTHSTHRSAVMAPINHRPGLRLAKLCYVMFKIALGCFSEVDCVNRPGMTAVGLARYIVDMDRLNCPKLRVVGTCSGDGSDDLACLVLPCSARWADQFAVHDSHNKLHGSRRQFDRRGS